MNELERLQVKIETLEEQHFLLEEDMLTVHLQIAEWLKNKNSN